MDLIKKLTGKNPDEYEYAARLLVYNSDVDFFSKLVKQDDFLFDYVKNNVAKRIQHACNKDNYRNLLAFLDCYSASYDTMIAEVLYEFGGLELLPEMKEILINGNQEKKAYASKYFSFVPPKYLNELLPLFREFALSGFEPLAVNSIEVLSKVSDEISKNDALKRLDSNDEFEKYNAVKFLVTYQAKDALAPIINVMKHSALSENIAAEIPYLIPAEELIETDDGILVLCNIINAMPEIIPMSVVLDYNLYEIFEKLYIERLSSASAVLLRLAQDKFSELTSNEEYLFDCDRNTKEEIFAIDKLLSGINKQKLDSFLYEELYDGSDFVLFAVDYANEIEELEALLDSTNSTLVLKVLGILKDRNLLTQQHKEQALKAVKDETLISYIKAV